MAVDTRETNGGRLAGKVAVVAVNSETVGYALVDALAAAGADVVTCGSTDGLIAGAKTRVEARGRRAVALRADPGRREDCERVVIEATQQLGGADILVNYAGDLLPPLVKASPRDVLRRIDESIANLRRMTESCLLVMRRGSSIVNISGVPGLGGTWVAARAHDMLNGAVESLTRSLAEEAEHLGIRVNALTPGFFESDHAAVARTDLDHVIGRIPVRRLGRLEELASVVVFLASADAAGLTGTVVPVDGGLPIA